MTTGYTVFDSKTLHVYGSGLDYDDAWQCYRANLSTIDHETEAIFHRDDPGSDLRIIYIRPFGICTDDNWPRVQWRATVLAAGQA